MNDQTLALQARDIYKTYTQGGRSLEILRGINLAVGRSESIALTGVSGSGKSTLLHILGGLDDADSGKVFVAGESMHEISPDARAALRNRCLGFVYQFHHLLAEFSAEENVAMPLLIRGVKRKKAHEKARFYIRQVGLEMRGEHHPGNLSGGERQRVAIARALVTEPVCALMDEPTGNLDGDTAGKIHDLLATLNQNLGVALMIVTHNTALAHSMGQIVELQGGVLRDVRV